MKLLREPMLHFAVAGALLFGVHAVASRGTDAQGGGGDTIVVSERELRWLVETSTRQWQRAPDDAALRTLMAEYIREEMLALEARELGLDRDDTVVRRRLAQKVEFLLDGAAEIGEPPEAELRAVYDAVPARFRVPDRISFHQEPLGVAAQGSLLLPADMEDCDEAAIAAQFGPRFSAAVLSLAPGAWHEPVASEFGLHRVLIRSRIEGRQRPFDEVRAVIAEEWRRTRSAEARAAHLRGLLDKYRVNAPDELRPLVDAALASLREPTR